MNLQEIITWHGQQAEAARTHAKNWEDTAQIYERHQPSLPVHAARYRECQRLARVEAGFHQAAHDLLLEAGAAHQGKAA